MKHFDIFIEFKLTTEIIQSSATQMFSLILIKLCIKHNLCIIYFIIFKIRENIHLKKVLVLIICTGETS